MHDNTGYFGNLLALGILDGPITDVLRMGLTLLK